MFNVWLANIAAHGHVPAAGVLDRVNLAGCLGALAAYLEPSL